MHVDVGFTDKKWNRSRILPVRAPPIVLIPSRMKLGKFRQSKFGLITAFCVMTIVLLIDMAGGFISLDGFFENGCHRIGIPRADAQNVLMVFAEPDMLSSGSSGLVALLEEIHRHSPRAIGVVATGQPRNYQQLDRLPYAKSVTVGFHFDQLLAAPGAKVSSNFQTGFSNLHFANSPVFRNGVALREQVGVQLPSFEFKLAQSARGTPLDLPASEFGVTWCGGRGAIGRIGASALVNGSSVSELIQGKVVIVGPDYGKDFGVSVPVSRGAGRMDRLEVRANLVECLLQGSQTRPLSFSSAIIWVVLVTLISIQLARQIPLRWCLAGVGIVIACVWVCCIISIWLAYVWLPVSMLSAAVFMAYATITVQRFDTVENFVQYWKLRSTVREAHLESRFEEGVWKAIGDSATQMFQPTRMVLLELQPGKNHLKNVCSIGCDYSHIFEKRLDYRRSPYFEAIEQNRPVPISRGPYFIATPGLKEAEFVLPMTNGLTVLGVIVLGMDKKKLAQWTDFEAFLNRFTLEMSQLVAGSRREAEDDLEQQDWFQRLQKLPEEREFIEIQRNSEKQNDLIERAELAFDCSESAMATFDIYGRVIRRNSSFNRMIQEAQLSIARTSCIEIISSLTGRSQNACRKIFREVILEDHSETIMLTDATSGRSPRVMYVKPMHLIEEERRTSIEMHGLLVEIVDGTPFENLELWDQCLANSLIPVAIEKNQVLDSRRETIRAIGKTAPTPQQALQDLFGSVGHTVDEIVAVLEQCKALTQRKVSEEVDNCFPVDSIAIWHAVIDEFEEPLATRSIRILEAFKPQTLLVKANPLLLDKVFRTAVQFLIDNAFDDSEVAIEFVARKQEVVFFFSNQGGGTPIETLRRSLQAAESSGELSGSKPPGDLSARGLTPAQSDQLAEVETWVAGWGGEVAVECHPHCMSVTIKLPNGEPPNVASRSVPDSLENVPTGDSDAVIPGSGAEA